jgi:hypothetical protein
VFLATLGNVPLAIGEGGHIGGVDSYVSAHGRVLCSKGRRTRIETRSERGFVLAELAREALAGPDARRPEPLVGGGCYSE